MYRTGLELKPTSLVKAKNVSLFAYPRLRGELKVQGHSLVVVKDDQEYLIEPGASSLSQLQFFFSCLDGKTNLNTIRETLSDKEGLLLNSFLEDLDANDFLDEVGSLNPRTGLQALQELEILTNDLIRASLAENIFWKKLHSSEPVPINVFYGFAIENYHFLYRESLFDSPVLSFLNCTSARNFINEFYISEYGHDEIVMRALNAIGIKREELLDSLPLPETMAMCNSLSHWASTDPIFFFSTLGVLEGGDEQVDPFLHACESHGVSAEFIQPMRQHADINRNAKHGELSKEIFNTIEFVDDQTMARMRRKTHLFIEMYNQFYTALWNNYSSPGNRLLRRISDFENTIST